MELDKIVIWGAGRWGAAAMDFLGKNNVEAFIDTYVKAKEYRGRPIISIDDYCSAYRGLPVLVAVRKSASIVDVLHSKKIHNYFLLSNVPREIRHKSFFHFFLHSIQECSEPLFYVSKFSSILLRIWLKAAGKNRGRIICGMDKQYSCLERQKEIFVLSDEDFKEVVSTCPCKKIINLSQMFRKYIANTDTKGDLSSFHWKHLGETAIIIGNGPSLTIEDLEKMEGKVTFATNRIYTIFGETSWRPTYYVASDGVGLSQWGDDLEALDLTSFIISDANDKFWSRLKDPRFVKYHVIEQDEGELPKFSFDITQGIYGMCTIVYECIQIAVFMGIRRIILLGVDFSYQGSPEDPANHFIPNYYENIEGEIPMFNQQGVFLALQSAKYYVDLCGIEIYNSTRGGASRDFSEVRFRQSAIENFGMSFASFKEVHTHAA